ncbi:MAG: phage portal protein [Azospirillaceae bacterium]|nr:phage portal protein [Azospirillaceae bacterium]
MAEGLAGRIANAVKYALTGDTAWFGPGTPLAPAAPPETAGRRFDYGTGINMMPRPRSEEPVTFDQLRNLARGYPLLALVISTRVDQLAGHDWAIAPVDKDQGVKNDPRVKTVTDFLQQPDREHDWGTWLGALVEEMLVTDAATIYPRKTVGGALYSLDLIDGTTIKRVLDDHGRTPVSPDIAYQQIIKGMVASDYTADELIYAPRVFRTDKAYGFSPVEMVVRYAQVGLNRLKHVEDYFTEGTVPDALCAVPEGWTPDQIAQFQAYFDALLNGDDGQKRKLRFVPAAMAKGFIQTKEAILTDAFDEWLARIICYALGVSAQWAVRQMNRATAETEQEQALQEGLGPLKQWVAQLMTRIIRDYFGYEDLCFVWRDQEAAVSPLEQAQIDELDRKNGIRTLNEIREKRGLPPVQGGDVLIIMTGSGAVKLDDVLNPPPVPTPLQTAADPQLADLGAADQAEGSPPTHKPPERAQQDGTQAPNETPPLRKAAPIVINRNRHIVQLGEMQAASLMTEFLSSQAGPTADRVLAALPALAKADTPADPPADPVNDTVQASARAAGAEGAAEAAAEAVVDVALDIAAWRDAVDKLQVILQAVVKDGAEEAISSWTLSSAAGPGTRRAATRSAVTLTNPRAVAYTEAHAAELVSNITQTTRDALRRLVVTAEQEGWSVDRLKTAIIENHAFSPARAKMIARTELGNADHQGNLIGWHAVNEVFDAGLRKGWALGKTEAHCAACEENAAAGPIPLDQSFPSGVPSPLAHPYCDCDMYAVPPDQPPDLAKAFNPGQPRDGNGRWTSGAGGAIARGEAAMRHVMSTRQDVHGAMEAPGVGPVSFIWGHQGDPARDFQRGYGISHIMAKHGHAAAMAVPTTLIKGTSTQGPTRWTFRHEGHQVMVTRGGNGPNEPWVLTGYHRV